MKDLLSRIVPSTPPASSRRTDLQFTRLPWFWLQAVAFVSLLSGHLFADQFGDFTFTASGTQVTITDYSQTAVGSVSIPSAIDGKTVIAIGSSAFYNCTALTSITIPQGVTSIGNFSFSRCTALTSVAIPSTITDSVTHAFSFCSALKSVHFLGNAPAMGANPFLGTHPELTLFSSTGKPGFPQPPGWDGPPLN